ncbi:hypothetical protein ACLI4R_14315 [Natrialbaceae archaeon A-chndr2]
MLGAIIGVVRFLTEIISYMIVYLFAKLIPFFVVVICLGVFIVLLSLFSVLLSPFGISDQAIAAVAAVGVFASLWILGLRVLFGISLLTPLTGRVRRWAREDDR